MKVLLSERSNGVMGLARGEASRLRHDSIGSEHILLGIMTEPSGVTAQALSEFGLTLARVRAGVEKLIGFGPPSNSPDDRGINSRAEKVLGLAREAAEQSGQPQTDPEHLLIGVSREQGGIVSQVLRDLKVPQGGMEAKVAQLIEQTKNAPRPVGAPA